MEDNDDLRNYLVDMLKTSYNIQACPNGKDALIIIREFNPDLVISDIMMPEMSGDELCSAIKGDLEMSHIPVVLLTALGDEKNMLEGLEIGADAYITKPFSVEYSRQRLRIYWRIVLCSVRFIIVSKRKNRVFRLIVLILWTGNL